MPLKPISTESANRIAILVIAKYGFGKTSLIRTINGQQWTGKSWEQVYKTADKVFVISAEAGLLALRDLITAGHIEGYEIGSLAEFKEVYQMLLTNEDMQNRYDWVFIDSLTEIAARCEEVMQEKYPDNSKSFRMWGDYTNTMIQIIKGFRDLSPYNVVFTCLETVDKDENNRRYIAPAVAGKGLKEKLPSFFDEVFYMQSLPDEQGNDRRVFYTQPFNELPAKDRSGQLDIVEIPNLLTIKHKILGEPTALVKDRQTTQAA